MMSSLGRTAGAVLLMGAAAGACTVPVFRYALDRWPADAYRLEAPQSWIDSPDGKAFAQSLDETRTPVELVPLEDALNPERLLMPDAEEAVVWSGTLDGAATDLFRSPAREELARHILAGASMVWVIVPGSDAAKNAAFEERLKKRLEYLGTVAAIPEQDPHDPESQLGPGPELRVGFSSMVVARDDPKEQVFLTMLAGPDGRRLLDGEEPFAGVVFGRGRVLGAWDASELDDEGVDEVSLFLLGACSCRVKLQNPGWDLAMAIDWDSRLMAAQMAADRALEAGAQPERGDHEPEPAAAPETVTFTGDEAEKAGKERGAEAERKPALTNVMVMGGVVGVAVLLVVAAAMAGRRA